MKILYSHPGLAGAMLGLALGLVEYFIALTMIRHYVARETAVAAKANEVLPGIAMVPGALRHIRIILIILAVTIYPAVGYFVGNMLAS